jgi:BMFP domain-containing protein YqiC
MLMTQTEMNSFLEQINKAFKDQFDKLDLLENRVKELEAKANAQEKGFTTSKGRRLRVQQAEEDS